MSEKEVRMKSTVERLKGMIADNGLRLAQERDSYVIRLDTLATEAIDVQNQYIKVLENRIVELEAENKMLRLTLGQPLTDTESP